MHSALLCFACLLLETSCFLTLIQAEDLGKAGTYIAHGTANPLQRYERLVQPSLKRSGSLDFGPGHLHRRMFLRGGGLRLQEDEEDSAAKVMLEITEYRNQGLHLNLTTYNRGIMESWRGQKYVTESLMSLTQKPASIASRILLSSVRLLYVVASLEMLCVQHQSHAHFSVRSRP